MCRPVRRPATGSCRSSNPGFEAASPTNQFYTDANSTLRQPCEESRRPFQDRGKKSLEAVAEGERSMRLPLREVGTSLEKRADNMLVLVGLARARRVHNRASRLDEIGGTRQQVALGRRKAGELLRCA